MAVTAKQDRISQYEGMFLLGQSVAADLDGSPVFLASSAFNLRYEQERWPKIAFTDVKDYQKTSRH